MSVSHLWHLWTEFIFKPRSPLPLGLFRILYGLLLLEYCYLAAPELLTCYSDDKGILRLQTLHKVFGLPVINLLAVLPPGDEWIIAVFAIFVIASFCLMVGLFTRISSIVVYLCLVSFDHRNIYVLHSGNKLMTLAAFWLMFAPAGAALSLDRIRKIRFSNEPASAELPQVSLWAQLAYQFQFILVYWQTSWAKFVSPVWFDGTAMYYVFRHKEFWHFPVPIVPDNLLLTKLATWGTLGLEFAAWTLIWFRETRYLVLAGLVLLHLGIEYSMNIPMFEHIMLISLILFVYPEDLTGVMDWIKERAAGTYRASLRR